ncbi:amidohydrolase family protein [Noviherbaspirillum sp. Root189]|uniref:amidohydrolase family protein n=1 Tax=Noviherbaspirillum sp. Root189 TaxID=1736487 RepID=UPI0007103118|nr:amidohydrolase family protein [Noviherbaspirillum sp. Root189]KRB83483.1 aminocarboxymuconate-semialdehyde decarboxylase [Noviherbaspirillum sp. Root189]
MTNCTCGAVDVHTHFVPEHFPAYIGKGTEVPWPSIVPAQPCHRHVMVSGKVYRTVSDRTWDARARIGDMDDLAIGAQVLSPMPELLSYWLDADDAAVLLRYINEEIAALVNNSAGRFFGLGAIPLQDVRHAIAELDYVINVLKLSGVEIAGNINGTPIGAPEFEPFWAAVETWNAAVFIHPLRPTGMDRIVGPKNLEQVLAFPSETGMALASLITGGVLERHPNLRIAASHGGGSFASLLPRLQHGWATFPNLREGMSRSPSELSRLLYFDSLVYEAETITTLMRRFGETQVLVGSDYPFAIQDPDPVGRIEQLSLSESHRALLLWENAYRWLGISAGG